jgi:GNAT superfamily N-acetyltransferase
MLKKFIIFPWKNVTLYGTSTGIWIMASVSGSCISILPVYYADYSVNIIFFYLKVGSVETSDGISVHVQPSSQGTGIGTKLLVHCG